MYCATGSNSFKIIEKGIFENFENFSLTCFRRQLWFSAKCKNFMINIKLLK